MHVAKASHEPEVRPPRDAVLDGHGASRRGRAAADETVRHCADQRHHEQFRAGGPDGRDVEASRGQARRRVRRARPRGHLSRPRDDDERDAQRGRAEGNHSEAVQHLPRASRREYELHHAVRGHGHGREVRHDRAPELREHGPAGRVRNGRRECGQHRVAREVPELQREQPRDERHPARERLQLRLRTPGPSGDCPPAREQGPARR
mmetsp:Transcript_34395/g.81099  ORF Transcript_34395/g.81099 Transcript_34395/m.81099 type:complete len:206 (-) Transcript_34395:375-992(-)